MCKLFTSPTCWTYNLQQILESDVKQIPKVEQVQMLPCEVGYVHTWGLGVPPNHPELEPFAIETYGFGHLLQSPPF